jgi:pimeloyl-ACP methyl ester carboxylesterase
VRGDVYTDASPLPAAVYDGDMLTSRSDPAAEVADLDGRARRHSVQVDGRAFAWRAWGAGPPLVLFHGAQGAWSHWIRNIEALAQDRTVWAADLPGCGDSDDPPEASHEAVVEILSASLRELMPRQLPVDVVGFSFGGVVAAHLAAAHPELVRRLVLVDTGGLDTPLGSFALQPMRGVEGEARRDAMRANLLALMLHEPAAVDELALHLQTVNVPKGRLNTIPLVMPRRLQDVLPRVRVQVDAIWGEYDAPHPDVASQVAALRRDQPDAEVEVIAGAGHWSMYERPAAFDRALRGLLDRPLRQAP